MDSQLNLYNSLTRKKEEFEPINPPKVGMYTCGPTIYNYPTIGNWRTYTFSDIVYRTLLLLGYDVTSVMNLTDVGHLTGDNEGDANTGEDRLEKASKKEGKTAWEIADFYGKDFINSFQDLNIVHPTEIPKATDHIKEQIELVQKIEEKGLTYKTSDGIYFDVKKYEEDGNKYGVLSTLDEIKEGARVEANPEKHDPRDFALWKFSPKDEKRHMEWDSPWGIGFPGWHIECSAMGMKYLGEQFDLHIGGEDLRSTHHPNEIAQSEAGTGCKPFVKYWLHGAFLLVDGGRMGKSLGNAYTLHDIKEKGFNPLALRYFYLLGHYRKQINFTWQALESAQNALENLWKTSLRIKDITSNEPPNQTTINNWKDFIAALEDDFNTPQALAAFQKGLDEAENDADIVFLMHNADKVLGLNLTNPPIGDKTVAEEDLPNEVKKLLEKREQYRKAKNWEESDKIRDQLQEMGLKISDIAGKTEIEKI